MSRALWFVAGATTSAYALVKARRAVEALTPEGMSDRLSGLRRGAELFTNELRTEMGAKETELRERLGLTLDGQDQIGAGQAPPLQLTRKGNT
ncbi:MAG TPA: DUF6167 family protein [Nocardioidaceae bacterium]|nr:DUF6167 family protein [Nocardioidaceae bacterium]